MPSEIKGGIFNTETYMRIILASASPRRKELLSQIVKNFEIIPAKGEEKADLTLPPEQIACRLAESKCDEVFLSHKGVVIGCDTIVVYGGKVLGKPKDEKHAFQMLETLSGKTHSVITGVCVRIENKKITAYEKTCVTFNTLTKEFIQNYIKSGSPMDKAGSYGIQDDGIVASYDGSYTNVVGLPVELLKKILKEVLEDDSVSN